MTTTTTANMALVLPNVLSRVGSTYASDMNTAMGLVDTHDHTSGKGVQVPAAGLDIDNNVSWGGYSITALKATTYTQQASVATANSVWFKTDGNAYVTNGSGTAVQLTSGSSLYSSSVLTTLWQSVSVTSSPTIATADTYGYYRVDTTAARTITLPSASAVGAGRLYAFQDVTGGAASFNITIARAGSDTIEGATSVTINAAYGWVILISTGTGWANLTPKFAGDLAGSSASQTVTAITGTAGTATVRCDTLAFAAGATTPLLTVADNATTAGVPLYIDGQTAGGSNQAGGLLHLAGGEPTGSGVAGGVRLAATLGGYNTAIHVGAFSASRRYVGFFSAPATTDIPTGDQVIHIANAAVEPSSNPVNGGVLWVSGGALKYRGSGGTVTTVGPA